MRSPEGLTAKRRSGINSFVVTENAVTLGAGAVELGRYGLDVCRLLRLESLDQVLRSFRHLLRPRFPFGRILLAVLGVHRTQMGGGRADGGGDFRHADQ